jgi:hypothetical protein
VLTSGGSDASPTGGVGGSGQGGTGASSGANPTGGTLAAGGASGAGTSGAGSGGETGLGDLCAYTDNTSMLNAIETDSCVSGYCVWDSRYLLETYCTIACAGVGAVCPEGYECTEDLGAPGKFWCVHPEPVPPPDMGAACESRLSYCRNSQYASESFCLDGYTEECAASTCVHDPIADADYCSMPCSSRVACPEGYECTRHPSGAISPDDHEFCIQRHELAEYVGRPCYEGSEYCAERPCPTREEGYFNCNPAGSGICVFDNRAGRLTSYSAYCSVRCEDTPCPAGFVCTQIETAGAGAPPSGQYCVSEI